MTNPGNSEHKPSVAYSTHDAAELVSVDDTIDDVARQALQQAQRVEEREKFRHQPGPVVAPQSADNPPIRLPFDETQTEVSTVGSPDAPGV
jgi:hypothetical protein